jgi:amino acid transporter
MFSFIKRLLIGHALRDDELESERLNVLWGLPILSSDAISSVAYAGEEILWVLVPVLGFAAYTYMFYAALGIVALLVILVFSYRQTIDNYPNGGGSYVVASDNLGTVPGLVAAASLSIDYILTVAVSTSAGAAAITSAFPSLAGYKVLITMFLILIMTIGNLRGMRESSRIFGIPTYLFIFSILLMIITGIFKVYVLGYTPHAVAEIPKAAGDITLFLFIRAFSSGCTALTGVEAVSNGVPNFVEPSQKHAKIVLILLGVLSFLIFGGTSFLATLYHTVPNFNTTVVSQIASQVFGNTFMFYAVQVTTAVILTMAANTAFSGFPTLLSLIARDGYAPRQFTKRGERLNFSNGILLLSVAAVFFVIRYKAETHLIMPMYAVGVFVSFTLSQSGMLVKWVREKSRGWRHKAFINGLGALVTLCISVVIGVTKFVHGAWIVFILITLFVIFMLITRAHYAKVAKKLSLDKNEVEKELRAVDVTEHVIVLIDSLNKASLKAINYAKHIAGTDKNLTVFHVSLNEAVTNRLSDKWKECGLDITLIIEKAPYRDIMSPLMKFIESRELNAKPSDMITIVMPQFVVRHWWDNIFHTQTALFIKRKLLHDRHIAIVTVPYVL